MLPIGSVGITCESYTELGYRDLNLKDDFDPSPLNRAPLAPASYGELYGQNREQPQYQGHLRSFERFQFAQILMRREFRAAIGR
jgi:hypothetical protein